MVERETESRIFLPENYVVLGYFQPGPYPTRTRPVPDPYLEFLFLEKMGYAGGTHAAVPRLYPYLSSTRYGYGAQIAVPVLHSLKATEKCPRHHQVELCWNVRIDFPTTKWLQIERGSVLYPYIRDKEMLF